MKRERSRARSKNRAVTLVRGWRAAFQMTGSRCTVHAMIDRASSAMTTRNGTEENIVKTPAVRRTSVQPPKTLRADSTHRAAASGSPLTDEGICGKSTPSRESVPASRRRTRPTAFL